MAKGSVRKKGKKWYYRFYVEDASGNSVQREFPGSESKSETEAMLRKAMSDYEEKQFVAKSENLTLAGLLDKWIEEEMKPGSLSHGTVAASTCFLSARDSFFFVFTGCIVFSSVFPNIRCSHFFIAVNNVIHLLIEHFLPL